MYVKKKRQLKASVFLMTPNNLMFYEIGKCKITALESVHRVEATRENLLYYQKSLSSAVNMFLKRESDEENIPKFF